MNRQELGIIGPTVCWYKVITARATSASALGAARLGTILSDISERASSAAGAADLPCLTGFSHSCSHGCLCLADPAAHVTEGNVSHCSRSYDHAIDTVR